MNASPSPIPTSPSRRALLAGALGGIGAVAASMLGRAKPTLAADGGAVIIGQSNSATNTTYLTAAADHHAFWANASGTGIALRGVSDGADAMHGTSTASTGGAGVVGVNYSTDRPAIVAQASGNNTGVHGFSGNSSGVAPSNTGIFGYADQDASAVGVHGESVDGIGVLGLATGSGTSAFGLFARSNSPDAGGVGARNAGNGTAILAKSGTGSFPTPKAKTAVYGYAAQDSGAKGIWGETTSGHAIHGTATSGYAGYFAGRVFTTTYHELQELSTPPAAPAANRARLFLKDNGSGMTQLCVRFNTGAIKILATQS